jgi:hypothetical protein
MWKWVLSISNVYGKAVGGFFFRRLFRRPSFPRPTPLFLRGEAQRLEELVLGLLHAGRRRIDMKGLGLLKCSRLAVTAIIAF